MEYHLIVDRAQAIWAIQKMSQIAMEELRQLGKDIPKNAKVSATVTNAMLNSILNSPAYAIQGLDVIYLQSDIPQDLLPYIIDHEELHLLVYKILMEKEKSHVIAGLGSGALVDSQPCRRTLAEVFNIPYPRIEQYMREWIASTLPHAKLFRFVRGIIRGIKHAISKQRRG